MKEQKLNNQIPKEHIKWGGLLNEFLWWCAGVNKKILRQCPADYAKYAGIGGTILFTALMAMLSGGYALYFVFKSAKIAMLFGCFWGCLIFNLDRFIVNTMYSDGKVTISWREFYSGLPRIIMAIFLGVVISTPLELKIFESEINVKIEEDIKVKKDSYIQKDMARRDSLSNAIIDIQDKPVIVSTTIPLNNQAQQLYQQINDLQGQINNYSNEIHKIERQINNISVTDSLYTQKRNRINLIKSNRNKLNTQLKMLQGQYATVSTEYNDVLKKAEEQKGRDLLRIENQIKEMDAVIADANIYNEIIMKEYGGFEARMEAFSEMRKEKTTTNISAWFIMILFIIIETAPTFFKMMIASGPYDDMLRAEMHRIRVLSDKQISDINDEVNTLVQISTAKNKEKLEAELLANKEVLSKIATVQAELLQTAIAAWREKELEKIKENPEMYIKKE